MTQVWPKDDAFPYGSLVYGTNVIGYLGARPNTTLYQHGKVHNGYGGASAAAQDGAQTSGLPSGWARRQDFVAPVRLKLISRKGTKTGAALTTHLIGHGVLGRIVAGTLTQNGTAGVAYQDLTCYACKVGWDTAAGKLRLSILKYVAGVESTLFTSIALPGIAGDFLDDVEIRLDITTDGGGNVALAAYLTDVATESGLAQVYYAAGGSGAQQVVTPGGAAVGTPISLPGAHRNTFTKGDTVLIGQVLDSSGSKITGAGRCGFFLDCEKAYAAPVAQSVSIAAAFEVSDLTVPSTPVVLWRDEFQRAAPQLAGAITDKFASAGRNLAADWGCDQAGSEATNILRRDTGSEAALAPLTIAGGAAIPLDGAADRLELQNADKTYPAPALPSVTEVTIAIWGKLASNAQVQRTLYDGRITSPPGSEAGFKFGLSVTPTPALSLDLTLSYPGGPTSVAATAAALSPYLNQTWCYVVTYRANTNPTTGAGRVRFYVGRVGTATLLGELSVPAAARPAWASTGTHAIGALVSGSQFFEGTVDECHVFFKELTQAQVDNVCNAIADPASFIPIGLVSGVHFDAFTDIGGADGKRWAPWFAKGVAGQVSVDTADWWREKNGITPASPGLVPVFPASSFVALSQRPVDDPSNQDRSITFKPLGDTSIGGLVVRASPGSTQGSYNGYRLDVAPGAPARIALYRVIGGVATKMAEQNPTTGTANVTSGVAAVATLHVAQAAGGGSLGPVVLTVKIAGTIVPMVSSEPGKSLVDIAGNVVDVSNERILSGAVEGFHGFVDGLSNVFDTWSQGTLGGETPTGAAPNYPIPEEADGAIGNLATVLTPEWSIEVTFPPLVTRVPFESGHLQTLVLDPYERRTFALHARAVESAQFSAAIALLRTFWDDHKGGEIPFQWNPGAFLEEQQAGYFRFRGNSWTDEVRGYQRTVSFEVEEVRAPTP